MESTNTTNSQSAIIFSSELIRQLEGPALHLPTNYIGVRQVRPAGGGHLQDGRKRKHGSSESSQQLRGDDVDDDWSPNFIHGNTNNSSTVAAVDDDKGGNVKHDAVVFKVVNPDGSERRMTSQEKKKLKHEIKQAKHLERKQEKQNEVKERVRIEKEKKLERKKLKWLAKKNKAQNVNNPERELAAKEQESSSSKAESLSTIVLQQKEDHDEETDRIYRGNPPVILTPAATRVAIDMGAIHCDRVLCNRIKTTLDDDLAKQWAQQIQESMLPVERQREKEDIRQMPYKLVPEVWTRLRPVDVFIAGDDKQASIIDKKSSSPKPLERSPEYSLTMLRHSSSLYDESAYLIFRHLHQHYNLHLACGARFGCDYLLYDGQREDKHSFAGLRIYNVTDNNQMLPIPSAYDMHGFVRAMNTARKIALVATVLRSSCNPNVAQIAIVDMALEAVLTAPTHIKKGNTNKRRCVQYTDELVKRKYQPLNAAVSSEHTK
jgi:tRNA splicing endonuclease